MSIAAYKQTIRETETPRQIEARLLARVTGGLERFVGLDIEQPAFHEGLKAALWENEKLWIAFKSVLVVPENELPPEVRAQLISLAFFVENHTRRVLRGEAKIEALIDVNKSIIAGLNGKVEADNAA
jgi:flagellar protein FlaF